VCQPSQLPAAPFGSDTTSILIHSRFPAPPQSVSATPTSRLAHRGSSTALRCARVRSDPNPDPHRLAAVAAASASTRVRSETMPSAVSPPGCRADTPLGSWDSDPDSERRRPSGRRQTQQATTREMSRCRQQSDRGGEESRQPHRGSDGIAPDSEQTRKEEIAISEIWERRDDEQVTPTTIDRPNSAVCASESAHRPA
jgi:hypothetical protein